MNMAKNMNPGEAVGEIMAFSDTSAELAEATSLGAGGADRGAVPLVRVDPEYPPRARQRGIEGYVDVEFTITAVGTVSEAHVIRSEPALIFDRAAINAVRKYRYNPMIRNGVPVERAGERIRIRFELDKG
jgi:protein TonB